MFSRICFCLLSTLLLIVILSLEDNTEMSLPGYAISPPGFQDISPGTFFMAACEEGCSVALIGDRVRIEFMSVFAW